MPLSVQVLQALIRHPYLQIQQHDRPDIVTELHIRPGAAAFRKDSERGLACDGLSPAEPACRVASV